MVSNAARRGCRVRGGLSAGMGPLFARPLAFFLLLLPPVCPFTAAPTSEDPSSPAFRPPATTASGPTADPPPSSIPGPTRDSLGLSEATPAAGPIETATSGLSGTAAPEATPHPGPWPAPVTDVAELCVCDLLIGKCDVNCCCDAVCTAADFSLFTACSIPIVIGDSHFCRQPAALYSIDHSVQPPERIFQLVDKVNPSVFCLQATNYKAALSFEAPEIPTPHNFERLFQEFGRDPSGTKCDPVLAADSETQHDADSNETSRYKFKNQIQTSSGFLRLPAPLFSQCAHNNPAGFLMNQVEKCNTVIKMDECSTVPELSMQFYTSFMILVVPNSSQMVNVTVQSIVIQTAGGLRTQLANPDVLLLPALNNRLCSNVVLEASYLVTFTEAGEIVQATVSLVLGTINTAFVQQTFGIHFIQQGTHPVPLSGSPGYVVGLPVKAGFSSGVIQNLKGDGQLTMMKSTPAQECFGMEGIRTPVLFGYSMMSGCQIRITKGADCTLLVPEILKVLKGQNFPDCVASFGDSQSQNGQDWVQISYNSTKLTACEIPVSFEMEVKWTKYGSLVNPQARIESLIVTIATAPLPEVEPGSEHILQVLSSVSFVDASAPAQPGYKAQPTIEAHLPFDFFFPFV